jgi:hypothetical protein
MAAALLDLCPISERGKDDPNPAEKQKERSVAAAANGLSDLALFANESNSAVASVTAWHSTQAVSCGSSFAPSMESIIISGDAPNSPASARRALNDGMTIARPQTHVQAVPQSPAEIGYALPHSHLTEYAMIQRTLACATIVATGGVALSTMPNTASIVYDADRVFDNLCVFVMTLTLGPDERRPQRGIR